MGAGKYVLERGEDPATLKDRVCSPGGTTIAGVRALEANGLRSSLIEAVVRAAERSRDLGKS
jgi:pyrroline-5-carboxylate reductase